MTVKEKIQKALGKAIDEQYHNFRDRENYGMEVLVEAPKDAAHGDYASNVAFDLAKKLKKNPAEIAQEIAGLVDKKHIRKVQAVGGFINFFIEDALFQENVKKVLKEKDSFGENQALKSQKAIVEYTDPNILKEFHIGHLMSNAIGESISRILEFNGAKIKRACYQSDVGLGIAKAIWGKMQNADLSWQNAYVFGTQKYDQDPGAKEAITALNKKIFERSDKAINNLYDDGKKWSLSYFETVYKKLGTAFDYYFFESEVADVGKKIVQENTGNIFETGENGAIIFKGEKVGLHTRVFINAEGLPTYEAKELGLAKVKYKKYAYDQSVVITGNEINDYFKVLLSAMSQIFPELAQKTKHIGHGMMRLPEGKMSSRTGKVVTFEFLLGEVEKLVKEKITDRELQEKEKSEITQKVAVGALKYSILKQSIGSDIVYDFEKSIAFEGDSGPYLQYSLARALSVLEKAKAESIKANPKEKMDANANVSELEKLMMRFPEVIEKSGNQLEPHYITLYLTQLAAAFNHYYAEHKIVDASDKSSPYKIALAQAFSIIMKNGLWLLGIPVLVKM